MSFSSISDMGGGKSEFKCFNTYLEAAILQTQLSTGTFRITFSYNDSSCFQHFHSNVAHLGCVMVCYLAEEADVETKRLSVP